MAILKKIEQGQRRTIKFLGIPIFQYHAIKYGSYSNTRDMQTQVFYLKMNRMDNYAFSCLQHWINIIDALDADFYIICDKKELKKHILKRIVFKNNNIKIIPSYVAPLKNIVKNMSTKHWLKATYAHLTTFFHAKNNNIKMFWNIDADDTMFLVEPSVAANILKKAQDYAEEKDLSAFSLDMWYSRSKKRHWSWGVSYVRENIDYFEIFNNNKDKKWMEYYQDLDVNFNSDWFFTYLRNYKHLKIETFYVENCYFVHFGEFLQNVLNSGIYVWQSSKLYWPIALKVMQNENLGCVSIADDCVKLDLGIMERDCLKFMIDNTNIKNYPKELKKLFCINI